MRLMDNKPFDFCLHHSPKELKALTGFKHRTFNATDLLYFIEFFRDHYSREQTLETAFTPHPPSFAPNLRNTRLLSIPSANSGGEGSKTPIMENILKGFHQYFFSFPDAPARTKKHIATPERRSTCKRLNMFLRWMVRNDEKGVDFGLWKSISPSQLICPIDLHVARVARRLNILQRKQTDWMAALELTDYLRTLDKDDPVKFDFALFGLGAIEKF